ncbi:glycosyl hydrolase [Brachybacterium ginsengisoli]|uniref:Glycosyl hydrolase n=1 Tax=Brachybacterium ginsengisoli TaxID=1331682 RepID=A0A291GWX0_9MICO|nr:glycoside hydrolase family 76 protein [Brachybacterium ginsengisoli]ATG54715.1 glycosyl hydrolase [Brachybacterium ginsengisoli]
MTQHESPSPSRRHLLAGGAGAAALAAAPVLSAAPALAAPSEAPAAVTPLDRERRATAAAAALLEHFRAETDPDMLIEQVPRQEGDPEFTYVWPLSQARAAVTELIAALGGTDCPQEPGGPDLGAADDALVRAQEHYWYPSGGTTGLPGYTAATDSAQGANGDFFYDDNDWIALLEIEQHLLTGGARGDLDRVGELLDLFRSGESTDPELASPGGIDWTQGDWNHDRNTVSTFPSAKVALRWHQLTGEEKALEDALRWMEWGRDTLLAPNGLFWDNIKPDGAIDRTHWTYNQGVPLGCEVLAHEITGEDIHRRRALDLVEAVHEHYSPLEEGSAFDDQPIQFNAILISNLLMAEASLGAQVQGRAVAKAYAQRLWENRRDPDTDLVTGSRESGTGTHLLDQAGFARSLALASMPRGSWHHLS